MKTNSSGSLMSLTKERERSIASIKFEGDTKLYETFTAIDTVEEEGKKDSLRYACDIDQNIWDGESAVDLRQAHLGKKDEIKHDHGMGMIRTVFFFNIAPALTSWCMRGFGSRDATWLMGCD